MKKLTGGEYIGERALFASSDLEIENAVFCDGESPLKESENISLLGCEFKWKYPLWYCDGVRADNCILRETARSGIWYTNGISMTDCNIEAPKTFRRSSGIELCRVNLSNAQETLWNCEKVSLHDVYIRGDYFGMGSSDIKAQNITVDGNYLFDGGKNIEVRGSKLISKDAFWNCENVIVYDSVIVGEYLGWNSKSITFVNCEIESNQGMCYMENVTLKGCRLKNTDLCFEYCTVDAEILSHVDSVKNPISGKILAHSFGEIILDPDCVDITKTEISEVKK